MLYDFPSGFSRAGHLDDDQLDRLNKKIIRNGPPRTGVFTVLVSTDDAVMPVAEELGADGQPTFASIIAQRRREEEQEKSGGAQSRK